MAFRFAEHFAYQRKGFALGEITPFFEQYQHGIPTLASRYTSVRKGDHFVDCVMALTPKNQRYALYDLCDRPPKMKGPVPDEGTRRELLRLLVQADGVSPLGMDLSAISVAGVREDWFVAAARIATSPPAAITAARTLIEATCSTILKELGEKPDSSGDLGRLFKQARKALGIEGASGAGQSVGQLCGGLSTAIDGLCSLSNNAGDRHGLVAGAEIDDQSLASLAVHAAGTVSLFLVQVARDLRRAGKNVG
jgi:hypothetical protein